MKILDNLINKMGNDKVLHFLGGGFICSFISFVVILQESGLTAFEQVSMVLIGTVFVLILSVLKDLIADEKADWMDVLASILGCVPVFVAVGLGAWFNQLS
nr:MAG TPA: putative periplasmic lipoprotein [Caudoviricetes sp.]